MTTAKISFLNVPSKVDDRLTLDRIVGLGRFVNGNVRTVRDG